MNKIIKSANNKEISTNELIKIIEDCKDFKIFVGNENEYIIKVENY